MDVAMNAIAVGILPPGQELPVVERIAHDEPSVRRLVARFGNPACCGRVIRLGRRVMGCTGC